ncbi:Hypothetical predicted protein [Octopus vulgaris]|uniref:Uncharacterized protein n=1 Tax=Octopus vulgaris TaxID=6645 RepID=A0AA36AWI2_OCTVU|nr:Hypothetical predicted protein [Octopus vulgaris]
MSVRFRFRIWKLLTYVTNGSLFCVIISNNNLKSENTDKPNCVSSFSIDSMDMICIQNYEPFKQAVLTNRLRPRIRTREGKEEEVEEQEGKEEREKGKGKQSRKQEGVAEKEVVREENIAAGEEVKKNKETKEKEKKKETK